jgi:hypothetical protein
MSNKDLGFFAPILAQMEVFISNDFLIEQHIKKSFMLFSVYA